MKQAFLIVFLSITFLTVNSQTIVHEPEVKHPQAPKPPRFIIKPISENMQLGIGGFVNVVGVFDFQNGLNDPLDFITYDIPVYFKMKHTNEFRLNANESRLFTELLGQTKYGVIKIYVETDFAANGNLRLRQAYGSFKGLTIGKTWSTFMDLSALPNTIDFEGPGGASASRPVQIRYKSKIGKSFTVALAIESPSASISNPYGSEDPKEYFPDIIGKFKFKYKTGHLQLAGVYRDISFQDTIKDTYRSQSGWGISFSGKVALLKWLGLSWQGIYGDGIANYLVDISGAGLDLVLKNGTQDLMALNVYGFFGAVTINLSQKLSSNLIYSLCKIDDVESLPDDEYKSGQYAAINLFYNLLPSVNLGIECLWGERKNKNNAWGQVYRLNFLTKFYF